MGNMKILHDWHGWAEQKAKTQLLHQMVDNLAEANNVTLAEEAGGMTDRTCGTCAWWDRPGAGVGGYGLCRYSAPVLHAGSLSCIKDGRATLSVEGWPGTCASDWCRFHATTRGWDAPQMIITAIEQSLEDENERLRARCQEAREIITRPRESFFTDEWCAWRDAWLNGEDG